MSKAVKTKKPKTGPAITQLPENVKTVVALDLSLNATGLCRLNLETGETVYRLIGSDGRRDIERLDHIVNEVSKDLLMQSIPGVQWPRPNMLVIIENFAFARANQAHQIGMLHGVIRYALWKLGIPFVLIAPMQLKKWVTGVGKADKNVVIKELLKRYGYDVNDDNIADAIGLATLCRALLGKHDKPLVQFQKEVVSKVLTGSSDSE